MLHPIDIYVIQKVKEKRLEKGITQSFLGFELDQSNSSFISKVESMKYDKKYNVVQLNEIARILECSICDFLPKEPIISPDKSHA